MVLSAKMTGMSEPTTPDEQPDDATETPETPETPEDIEADAAVGTEDATEEAPEGEPVEEAPEGEPVATTSGSPTNQAVLIGAALAIVAVIVAVIVFAVTRGDDKPSDSEQAKKAAVTLLQGLYKVRIGDVAGCQQVIDNLLVPASEDANGALDRCTKSIAEADPAAANEVTSIVANAVTVDKAAGTAKVTVTVTETVDGTPSAKPATMGMRKVDGRWKYDPTMVTSATPPATTP